MWSGISVLFCFLTLFAQPSFRRIQKIPDISKYMISLPTPHPYINTGMWTANRDFQTNVRFWIFHYVSIKCLASRWSACAGYFFDRGTGSWPYCWAKFSTINYFLYALIISRSSAINFAGPKKKKKRDSRHSKLEIYQKKKKLVTPHRILASRRNLTSLVDRRDVQEK